MTVIVKSEQEQVLQEAVKSGLALAAFTDIHHHIGLAMEFAPGPTFEGFRDGMRTGHSPGQRSTCGRGRQCGLL